MFEQKCGLSSRQHQVLDWLLARHNTGEESLRFELRTIQIGSTAYFRSVWIANSSPRNVAEKCFCKIHDFTHAIRCTVQPYHCGESAVKLVQWVMRWHGKTWVANDDADAGRPKRTGGRVRAQPPDVLLITVETRAHLRDLKSCTIPT
jgi:hypothetical protein